MFNRGRDFDKKFKKAEKLMIIWFAFCAVLALSVLSGLVFFAYKLLIHLGVL